MTPAGTKGLMIEVIEPENHGAGHQDISQKDIWEEYKREEKHEDKYGFIENILKRRVAPY